VNEWIESFSFSIAGAALLLSVIGLWFTAVMVVKMIPLAFLPASNVFKCSRLSACIGSWRKNSLHFVNCPYS